MTRRIGLFIKVCEHTQLYTWTISGSYNTEAWKYYIINLRYSKLQQIFWPRIILLIQVHPKKVYSREIKKYQLGSVRVRTHADYIWIIRYRSLEILYYKFKINFSKLQQIFRPRISLLIQVHPKKVYSREIKIYQLGSVRVRTHADYDNSA